MKTKMSMKARLKAIGASLAVAAAVVGGVVAPVAAPVAIGTTVVAAAAAADVVTAPSSDAYTQTVRYRWLYFYSNGSYQGQCWLGYDRNYSGWEEWTGQGTDGWYPSYRIGDWNCGKYRS